MKQIDKIIESQEAPKDKNVLWIKGDKLLSHVNGKWAPVGGGSASTKNQDKSVEIVENGVTEVTADSGYTGLGKVTINANVQGGESGGGLTYYRFPSYASLDDVPASDTAVVYNAARLRIELSDMGIAQIGVTFIGGGNFREDNILEVRAFAVDKRARYIMAVGGQTVADMTLEEYLAQNGVSFSNYEEISEEEFYAI